MQFYGLALGILGVWRVTHLLYVENGPWNVFSRWRERPSTGFFAGAMRCFYCLSLWVSAPFALLVAGFVDIDTLSELLMTWLAFSAGAILLERVTTWETLPMPEYYEDPLAEEQDESTCVVEEVGKISLAHRHPHR
jgi:hypothetical protein